MARQKKRYLLVGTQKGAFIFTSTLQRNKWTMIGPLLKGAEVDDIVLHVRSEKQPRRASESTARRAPLEKKKAGGLLRPIVMSNCAVSAMVYFIALILLLILSMLCFAVAEAEFSLSFPIVSRAGITDASPISPSTTAA